MNEDVAVVVRSSQERTVPLNIELLKRQVPEDRISVIEVAPFSAAVKKTFEIGLESKAKWTLAVDGDILIYPDAIQEHVERAASYGPKLYSYQGHVKDKIFGTCRGAGPHLFNSEYLEKGLEALDRVKDSLRPESGTYRELAKQGYITVVDRVVFALHDYEQKYADLFRKAYFYSKKHGGEKTTTKLITHWRQQVKEDKDFKVLFYGWVFGCVDTQTVYNDRNFFDEIVAAEFPKLDISEKEALNCDVEYWMHQLLQHKNAPVDILQLKYTRLPRTEMWLRVQTAKKVIKRLLFSR
ncbi:hypothetical protein [Lewinella sp. IMCC34183]|uniref:hypothetical protein n=1 Tax=Lewinella sp. IMCC34183 TaxID=2248762 RepID=UPI000E23985F|nr:hypothetical protein [Lewinella sp. IMCC34183]